MMSTILDSFFNQELDCEINELLPEYGYEVYKTKVMSYVEELLSIDISDYLVWLDQHFSVVSLSVEDAVQYSKLTDATNKAIVKMIENGDKGYTHIEIGKMIQDDGKYRKDGAYLKYGENHIKVAKYLGYAFSMNRYYYVSIYGYAGISLDEVECQKLYSRLFVRTPLFRMVHLLSKNGTVNMRELFDCLSDSTYLRRRGNIKRLFDEFCLINQSALDMIKIEFD